MSGNSDSLRHRDRHADQAELDRARRHSTTSNGATDSERLIKPPVLRRSTIRLLCVVWLGLVIYGTLGPMGVEQRPWIECPDQWRWAPPVYHFSYTNYNDIFTNILVYLPAGTALGLLLRRRSGVWAAELTAAMFLAVMLSYFTELLQQLMPARCYDRGDLVVNSAAALVGCLLAPAAQRTLRRLHLWTYEHWRYQPWLISAWAMTILTLVLMILPLDFYWPTLEMTYKRDFDLLDMRRFGAFVILGFLIAMAMIERHGRCPLAVGEAVKRIFVCGVFFEAAQIILISHACGLLDISTAFFGGLAGIGVARWLTAAMYMKSGLPSHMRRNLATWLLFSLVLGDIVLGLYGVHAGSARSSGSVIIRAPFQIQFLESFDRVMIYAFESIFIYATITMLCLYLTLGEGRCATLLLLLGLTGGVELARALVTNGSVDFTRIAIALAAWIVVVRCWRAFVPQIWRPEAAAGSDRPCQTPNAQI